MLLRRSFSLALLSTALLSAGLGHAQVPTNKGPLRLVVGFPAGGSADVLARDIAEQLKAELGVPVIVDNRAGAGGQIAADYVKTQAGDGLTVLLGTQHMLVMAPLTSRSVKYSMQDFKAVGRIGTFNEAVAVPFTSPVTSLAQWLDAARKDPKVANYGVPAPGSVPQFIGFQLGTVTKTGLLSVPYKGTAPLTQDLLAGQIASGIAPIADVAQHHGTRLRALAINGPTRSTRLPDVPTLRELGYTQFDTLEWTGLFAPASTSAATLNQLQAALAKAVASPALRETLLGRGTDPSFEPGAEFEKRIANDLATWGPVVKASGFSAD